MKDPLKNSIVSSRDGESVVAKHKKKQLGADKDIELLSHFSSD